MFRDARCWAGVVALLVGVTPAWGQPPNRNEVTGLVFLADGKTVIAACLDDKLHVYDPATAKERSAVEAHKDGVWAVALSADGKFLATGGGDNLVKLWDAATLKELKHFEGHTKEVLAVAFSPDGKTLVSGGADRSIRTWDVATAKEKKVWHGHELKVLSVAFSPDGKTVASGGSCTASIPGFVGGALHADQVRLWDAETGKEIGKRLQTGTTVCFTPDGRTLAAAGTYVAGRPIEGGGTIVNGGTTATIGPPLKDTVWGEMKNIGSALALSSDGRLAALAYGCRLHTGRFRHENDLVRTNITLWETATGKEIMELPSDGATVVAISPDGKKLAAGSTYLPVTIWDLTPPTWQHAGKEVKLDAKEMDKLWADLAAEDPKAAYTAVWTLAAAGVPVVDYLKGKLQPEKAVGDQVKELLPKLDSDKYAEREAAFRDLKKLGPAIEPQLRAAAADKQTSVEARKRLQKLLETWEKRPATPDELRLVRAIQVLERIASKEAREVLGRLADGPAESWATDQARLAAKRLELR
jgi:hypothetical protein